MDKEEPIVEQFCSNCTFWDSDDFLMPKARCLLPGSPIDKVVSNGHTCVHWSWYTHKLIEQVAMCTNCERTFWKSSKITEGFFACDDCMNLPMRNK